MKFQCYTSELAVALQTAAKALPTRSDNKCLEGVLIEAGSEASGDDMLTLTCADERITIVTHLHATVEEPGRGVVPGKLFGNIVRKLTEPRTTISMDERFIFNICSGSARMNISGLNGDYYPALPEVESASEVKLPQDMLREMIQKVSFAVSVDDARDILTGCLLEIEKGNINMVALDGYRMALCKAKCSDMPDKISAIIPGRAANEISSILTGSDEVFAQLSFSGNKLRVRLTNNPADAVSSVEIYVILIEGEYIGYRQILPRSFATRAEVALEPFRRAIDRVLLVARESANKAAKLIVQDGELMIEAHSEISDVHEELPIEQDGPNVTIGFNVRYLADMAKLITTDTIVMNFNNAVQPCVVTPKGSEDYVHLILPVRLGTHG